MQNEEILLRAVEPEDLELMYGIENTPELWEVSNTTVPYSRYVLKQYIESMRNDVYEDKQLRLIIVRRSDNEALGMIDLVDFSPLHNRAEVGVVVKEAVRGQGIAKQALELLMEYCFSYLHLHQLYAFVEVDNAASRELFAACGFTESGVLKHWLWGEEAYRDVLFMQRLD